MKKCLLLLAAMSAVALAQAVTIPMPGLPHRWTFDETAMPGTTSDDAVGTKDGTFTPAGTGPTPSTTNLPPLVFANPACLAFNGTDQYLAVNGGLLDVLGGTASLSVWMTTTQVSPSGNVWESPGITGVEQSGGGDDVFWGYLDTTGRVALAVGNGAVAASANPINDGQWHHVVLTRDQPSGVLQVYVDGALSTSATGETFVVTTAFASIGRIEDTGGTPVYYNGRLDDLRVYNRVLAANEVALLAAGYDGITPPPGAPTNLNATAGNGTVSLTWTASSGTVSGYRVYRNGVILATTTLTHYTDTTATNSTTWTYYVVAFNDGGESAPSSTVSATPVAPPRTNDHEEGVLGDNCACGSIRSLGSSFAIALLAGLALLARR